MLSSHGGEERLLSLVEERPHGERVTVPGCDFDLLRVVMVVFHAGMDHQTRRLLCQIKQKREQKLPGGEIRSEKKRLGKRGERRQDANRNRAEIKPPGCQ